MRIPFRAIEVFFAVSSNKSITAAAKELSVTPSAVSQQIKTLEEQLGTSLLLKDGRGIKLTEAGERYFEMIAREMEQISVATREIKGERGFTLLNIRGTPSLCTKWLVPRIHRFLEANPDIDVHLDGSNEPTDFAREEVDIEIRHGEGRWRGFFVEPLAVETFYPVCSPKYAAAGSLSPEDLAKHRLIHSIKSQMQWHRWFSLIGVKAEIQSRQISFDRSHMAIDVAKNGIGIALESNLMMEQELLEGTLVLPVSNTSAPSLQTQWIVCPHHHLRRRKVSSFINWLKIEATIWEKNVQPFM